MIGFGHLAEHGELLHQPLAILEEIGLVVGVELVPPLLGLVIEALLVEIRDAGRRFAGR
jgi:hypothetical protein